MKVLDRGLSEFGGRQGVRVGDADLIGRPLEEADRLTQWLRSALVHMPRSFPPVMRRGGYSVRRSVRGG